MDGIQPESGGKERKEKKKKSKQADTLINWKIVVLDYLLVHVQISTHS